MSFKIFSLQLTGKIKPVEKIENQREALYKNYQEFLTVEKSDELKEYIELESYINSSDFKKKKAEIESLQFKGSKEYNELAEFEKLKKTKKIKHYFKVVDSQELVRFEKIANSEKPAEFKTLKEYVGGGKFTQDKKEKKEEALDKKNRYKLLKSDPDVRFYTRFKKSSLYRNYLDVKSSKDLRRYEELKERTASNSFLERKAYLEDKKKWEKTEEFTKLKKFEEIKGRPHIQNYFKYKGSSDFDFIKGWKLTFEDNFSGALDSGKWSTVNKWAEHVGENFSLPGDLHFFTSGENIKTNGKLTIEVKKEKVKGKVWKMPAGFVPVDFDYTSGLLSTSNGFGKGDEIFEAKIKFHPVKQLVSTLSLSGDNGSPMVNLLEMGTKNRLGISKLDSNNKIQMEGLDISNLKAGKWYIFSVEKSGSAFTWKINDTEVLSINKNDIQYPLNLNASTIVVDEIPGHLLPNAFEIGWVKCYRKK
ncbi:LamG domain-containing protein [Maribellus maritimus]|uniref:hypothetical protein n=1 Tax=Maribellus maritimus TaxID=2870838 RepID=UPI001EEC8235|nr:hypothetical protein [Maribellus maritimus]MCG6188118.1 hypothetical protein [Maribellus maritimus]